MAINSVVMTGRLVNDPESRQTPKGLTIASFRVAVDRDTKGEDGKPNADFFDVVAFGKTGEVVMEYFVKGSPIGIEGRAQSRVWTGDDGKSNYNVEFVVTKATFMETKAEAEQRRKRNQEKGGAAGGGGKSTASAKDADGDDFADDFGEPDPFGDE